MFDLTPDERDALMFLPAPESAYVYGPYPHGETRPVAADTIRRAAALFRLESEHRLSLSACVAVDRPGCGVHWRDKRWVLTDEGLKARAIEEMRIRPAVHFAAYLRRHGVEVVP